MLGRLRAVANTPTPPTSAVPDCTQSPCAQVPAPTKHTWNRRQLQPARRTARLSQVATSGTVLIWFGMGRHCAMAGVHTDRNIVYIPFKFVENREDEGDVCDGGERPAHDIGEESNPQ